LFTAFISGCKKHLPTVNGAFNIFYIVKEVNKPMDEIRKIEFNYPKYSI
jgi:hypothetical protein